MEKCSYADKYKEIHPPKCNNGNPCDKCKEKWENMNNKSYFDENAYQHRLALGDLRRDLNNANRRDKIHVIAFTWCEGLMIPKPLIVMMVVNVAKKTNNAFENIYLSLHKSMDDREIDGLFNQTLEHMQFGTDMNDLLSAGGWDKQELNKFISFCVEKHIL